MLSVPLQTGFDLEQVGIAPFTTLTTQPGLLGGKVHGSLARAGKVKGQTPKVDAEEKKKAKTGRAKRRMQVSTQRFWISYIGFSMICQFLERILMEHIDIKSRSGSKLQIGYVCSIRIRSRIWDKFNKRSPL